MRAALGSVRLNRESTWRRDEGGRFRADQVLGIDGFPTRQATRLLALAGVEHSFSRAEQVVQESCGWQVDDDVIRRATRAQATRAAATRADRSDASRFAHASGAVECGSTRAGRTHATAGGT